MNARRGVTEEDLLITEAFIAKSYTNLKQSVRETPTRVIRTVGETVHEHPLAATGAAVVAGVALCGIAKIVSSSSSVKNTPFPSESIPKETNSPDLMHELLLLMLPLVVPYVVEYMLKGNGVDQS